MQFEPFGGPLMIQPVVLMLGAQLLMPVANSVPTLDVRPVCRGIAQQGGATGREADTSSEIDNCIKSEQAMRDQIVKDWSTFSAPDRTSCVTESKMGGEFELYRASHLPGDGTRRAQDAQPAAGCPHRARGR